MIRDDFTLHSIICKAHSENKKIVFSCGCFDILHIGHLEYLEIASTYGDLHIVGINSDNSICKIKNREPIFSDEQRAKLVSAFSCVDYVFVFEEEQFDRYLKMYRPHVFAKGIDRRESGVAEEKTCISLGIDLLFAGEFKLASSSQIVHKLYQRFIAEKNDMKNGN
ncbi:MAG: adenylyltransferase/cytidyltransferase family protein [Bacillota bacterium]